MGRKGKEPAGLRRWRLAQRRKRSGGRTRRVRVVRRRAYSMARRRRGRKGGRRSKSIPVAPLLPVGYVAYRSAIQSTPAAKVAMLSKLTTGYDPITGTFTMATAMPFWTGEVAAVVVHKVANKTINKYIRKATMGYLSL